jgi:hypothetical protein
MTKKRYSKRIDDLAYVVAGDSYDSYIITEHVGGSRYLARLEYDAAAADLIVLISGAKVHDSIEPVEPWLATIETPTATYSQTIARRADVQDIL